MSTITTINPATEKEIQTYEIMTEKQATDRLEACHAAFLQWRELSHQERAPYLKKIGQKLRDNADELAALMTNETGKLLKDGRVEVELCAAIFDYTAENGPDALADEEREQGLNGSDGAGRHIGAVAAKALKKTVLELGSNDAYLVLEDADIETAVKFSVMGRLYNNGETCISAKRFIVTDKVYDAFVDAFVAQMKDIVMGDPTHKDSQLGPLSSQEQFDTVKQQVDTSVAKGAKILCGGEVPDRTGAFYPATVLADLAPGMPAFDDEIFGPVASIIRARDDEDAMRLANESRYGLGGGIFSKDEERALKLARDYFDTGMIRINSFGAADPNMPFGGVKNSGYGREHGGFGMKEFVNVKSIFLS
jgi:acyl-CoA reductase-like NAD-dependent aldehyde dehydrogenase